MKSEDYCQWCKKYCRLILPSGFLVCRTCDTLNRDSIPNLGK